MTVLSPKCLLPGAFGVLMVAAAAHGADRRALVVAGAALVAVLAAGWLRPIASVAVLLTVLTVVLADPGPMYAALAGLSGAAYLVLRHGDGAAGAPSMIAAVGFAVVGTVAIAVPVAVPWLPMAAPLVLLAAHLLALKPLLDGRAARG